ncbi:hydrogenase iron-sulfur subunit [Candidatus Latescibacterota bacterium]
MNKDPIIIAFCCHYCAFTAADLAGTMRQQYPTNVRIVRLPCTGKVDIGMMLHAFVSGADGVMVAGCEDGSCHFMSGNLRAIKRVTKAKKLLEETGVNPERLDMFHIAASQGPLFAQKATEFTERIKGLNMESTGKEKDDISNRENTDENCKPMEKNT